MKNTYNIDKGIWEDLTPMAKGIVNDFMKETIDRQKFFVPKGAYPVLMDSHWIILCQNMAIIAATVAEKKELVITNY